MTFEFAYRSPQAPTQSNLRDLDLVVLTAAAVTDDGDEIPVGSEGTIVSVVDGGEAYVVEFPDPPGALASVEADQIEPVERIPR